MINPEEIVIDVKKAPPYNQGDLEKSYSGLKIEWTLLFSGFYKTNHKISEVRCYYNEETIFPWIYFDVELNKYPEFKTLHEKKIIIVKGIIDKVRGSTINLKDIESIKFLPIKKESSDETTISKNNLTETTKQSDSEKSDLFILEPNFYGVGIRLKTLWERYFKRK